MKKLFGLAVCIASVLGACGPYAGYNTNPYFQQYGTNSASMAQQTNYSGGPSVPVNAPIIGMGMSPLGHPLPIVLPINNLYAGTPNDPSMANVIAANEAARNQLIAAGANASAVPVPQNGGGAGSNGGSASPTSSSVDRRINALAGELGSQGRRLTRVEDANGIDPNNRATQH